MSTQPVRKANTARLVKLGLVCNIALGLAPVQADNTPASTSSATPAPAPAPSYKNPPMTAFNSQMDDPLLGNPYQKPVWNLHDFLNLPDWLSVGLEQRTRYETLDGTMKANTQGGDQQLALQTDLWLQARWNKFRFATEFMDARAVGADIGPSKHDIGSGVNNNMADPLDFLQAYISWADTNAFDSDLGSEVKVGRQTMDIGSRRLIGRNTFRNTVNSFTGVRWRLLDKDKWMFQAFATLPVVRMPTSSQNIIKGVQEFDQEATRTWFSGGILEGYKLYQNVNAEVYLYNLDEADSFNNPTRKRRYFTPGLRFYIKPQKGHFDFQAEGMGQFGTVRYNTTSTHDQQHEAWSEHVDAGYSFDAPWSPRFMMEYDYASGSHNPGAKSDSDGRFDPLYGPRGMDWGPSGIYSALQRSNISSPGYKLYLVPRSDVTLTLQQRLVWLASASDCWGGASCTSSTNLVLDPTKHSGSYVGDQIGLTTRYNFNSSLNFEVGYFHLFKGQFAKEGAATVDGKTTVPGADVNYFYAQSELRF